MQRLVNNIPRVLFVSSVLGGIATAWAIYARLASAACRPQTRPPTTQQHPPLTYEQREEKKREFISSIREEAICALASRHNDGKPCRVFGSDSGSFNACFFVEFPHDGTRWVLRVPIQPAVYDDRAKVRSEVATMKYIQSKTTIPVPRVRAFGEGEVLTRDLSTTQTYLILDYVPGHSLDIESLVQDSRKRRDHFYAQLVDILAQMRALEFASAGSLLPDPAGRPDHPIIGPLRSIHINEMQVQGSTTAAPSTAFASATDFCLHQLGLIQESYRLPISDQSLKEAQRDMFALEHLEREVPRAINASWNEGPFVLSHLDLRWNNIIVDDDLNIRAVIDWEWAGAIPRQFCTPPSWIAGREPPYVTGDEYRSELAHFRRVLLSGGDRCRQLVEDWALEMMDGVALPIAEVLRHHSQLNPIFFEAMYPKLCEGPSWEVVPLFFDRPENRELEVAVREQVERSAQYTTYLRNKGLFVPDEKALADAKKLEEMQNWLKKIQEG